MGEDQITTILMHFDDGLRQVHEKIDQRFKDMAGELRDCQRKREEFHKELQPIVDEAGRHTGYATVKKLRRDKILDQCKGALIVIAVTILLKYFGVTV